MLGNTMPPHVDRDTFEQLAEEALDSLPPGLRDRMSNVEIFVEDVPGEEAASHGRGGGRLLGLYQGIPLTHRSEAYWGVMPDRIFLYQHNIESSVRSLDELRELVRTTVIHEVAHHFGIDDDRLDELGWA
jgi:predicted Zn-dependent protease with MMP-like domain